MRELIFIHGRSQQGCDPDKLKEQWIDSWKEGLEKNGLAMPITEDKIHFPFYGDTLAGLVNDVPEDEVAKIIVRGDEASDAAESEFVRSVVMETLDQHNVTDEQIQDLTETQFVERGILNWEWVHTGLKAMDRYIPGASGASVAIATRDVYLYLRNPTFRRIINNGVKEAINRDAETVVVGHSLGSVVSYSILREFGTTERWKVPLYMTVGAPLGVTAVKRSLQPIKHPACADEWFNAMDERDVVALYPLDGNTFDVDPAIANKTDVDNFTSNHHGIIGYLSDAEVAKRLHDAVST